MSKAKKPAGEDAGGGEKVRSEKARKEKPAGDKPGGEKASAEDLLAWCKQNLAGYKCPRYVVFAELPKTSTGKIQKFKLREMAKEV